MGKHLKLLGILILGLACTRAAAQDTPKVDVSAGYSYVRANLVTADGCCFNMHGGGGSIAYNVNNWLGWAGDVGVYRSSNVKDLKQDLTLISYVFGPRFSFRQHRRYTPFMHVLVGGGHAGGALYKGKLGEHHSFNMITGGGIDIQLGPHVSWRLVQADYFYSRFLNAVNDHQNNLRLSTGLVFHFGSR
ncbi:MAG TPA: outer membrane beta-barrel protein [Candidatus Dormibacteraeota bacterium]|nr:outer membrane beta-barrel protein [Candidatus Dormibacteraeota bacterium]